MFTLPNVAMLGASQGLILLIAILTINFGNRRANRILAAFIGVLSLRLFVIALEYQSNSGTHYPRPLFALLHLSYAIGPLLYFYVRLLVEPDWPLRARQLWHFLPIPIVTLLLRGPILSTELSQYNSFASLPEPIQSRMALFSIPVFISLVCYSLLSLQHLKRYRQTIRQQFSSLDAINLNWLRILVWSCLCIAALSLISELYRGLTGADIGPRTALSVLFSVLLVYYIGLMGLRQPVIFDQGERLTAPAVATNTAEPDTSDQETKYQKSGLDEDRADRLWHKLNQVMDQQRPHLQAGIKLAELANRVGTRPNYLSQVINSRAGESFFDFINRHRIEQARQWLLESRDTPVSEIAMAAGFNSQNVFNAHFKKHMGVTPTQLRKQHTSEASHS